jgi:hypothetical protein
LGSATSVASVPTTPINFVFTKDLQLHDKSIDVMMLQKFLNTHGSIIVAVGSGSPGSESNYFGVKTWQALMKFQASVGIHATGYFGSITRAYVNAHE